MTLQIARVTVHPDGAVVVREGRLAAAGGLVLVRELPLVLDPSSVRVTVRGAAVGEVKVDLDVAGEDRGAAPAALEAWLDGQDALALVATALDAAREERRVLAHLQPGWEDHPRRSTPDPARIDAWASADQAVTTAAAALDDRIRELQRDHERQAEAVEILRRRVEEESSEAWWRRWLPTRRAVVRVDTDGEVEVEVSYRVPGATWSAAYVLDADAPLRSGRFAMRALVVQATGEDWRGVRLALSTAPAERRVDVPELSALRLGARQPPADTGWRELPPGLEGLFPDDLDRFTVAPSSAPSGAPAAYAWDEGVAAKSEKAGVTAASEAQTNGADLDLALLEEPTHIRAAEAPTPVPSPQAFQAPARKSAGPLAAVGRVAGALMPAAPPAPRARHAPAGGAAARPAEPESLEPAADLLDYGHLRMAGWDAPRGRRGHLAPTDDDAVLTELRVPPAARAQLAKHRTVASDAARSAAGRPLPPHHVVPAPIGGSDLRVEAAGTVDVPSDGRFHSVAVVAWPATLDVAYRAVPRHDPRVFRRVTATLAYTGPLVGGPVDVYVDGRLELTTPWAGTPGRGKLLLGLGAEDRLKLVRNVRYREESAGIFSGSRRQYTAIEVQVASSLGRPVAVELLERVPVPLEDKDATIEVTEASPVANAYEGDPDGVILKGGRVQTLEVPPGGTARAVLTYAVTLGGKDEIVGGDRRG